MAKVATFDGPARAIHYAAALRDAMRVPGVELRKGYTPGRSRPSDSPPHGSRHVLPGLRPEEDAAVIRRLGDAAGIGSVVLGDLLLTKPEQGETETHQDEPSPQKTKDSD